MKQLIRPALPDDFATLVAIDQSCFEEDVAYDAYELRYFMSKSSATTLVAEVDGAIAGFLSFEIRGAQSGANLATLVTLDVTDIYRNAGIGSALLAHSEEHLANYRTTRYRLQVDTTNSVALDFYSRRGFHIVRTLRLYYPNGADAYLMEKRLGALTRVRES